MGCARRRHGVVAARMPRMATGQPAQSKINAIYYTMHAHGFQHIIRAGGLEAAATAKEGREGQLVGADEKADEPRGEGEGARHGCRRLTRAA